MSGQPAGGVRLAAAALIVRDSPFQVLMVRRRASSFYSSAIVFPGGLVEPEDFAEDWRSRVAGADEHDATERALRVGVWREVFEETSLLLAGAGAVEPADTFLDIVSRNGARLPLDDIVRFGHWITPERVRKRFDTHFFLCAAPDGAQAKCDGEETVGFEWVRPIEALARAASRQQPLLFPQLMNLRWLAESTSVADAFSAARARPIVSVTPRIDRREHGIFIIIPEAAGYGVTEFTDPGLEGFAN